MITGEKNNVLLGLMHHQHMICQRWRRKTRNRQHSAITSPDAMQAGGGRDQALLHSPLGEESKGFPDGVHGTRLLVVGADAGRLDSLAAGLVAALRVPGAERLLVRGGRADERTVLGAGARVLEGALRSGGHASGLVTRAEDAKRALGGARGSVGLGLGLGLGGRGGGGERKMDREK